MIGFVVTLQFVMCASEVYIPKIKNIKLLKLV